MYRIMICLLFAILSRNGCSGLKRKKCLQLLSTIPVYRNLDMTKFLGTWYTISRTKYVWGDTTYESSSIEFSQHDDGTFTYSLTGQLDRKCLPVETGAVEVGHRKGQFLLKSPDTNQGYPTMIISYTDYNTALVYFCFRYRPGRKDQCQKRGWQAEVMSRSAKPRKKVVRDYLRRAQKRLCVAPKDIYPTKAGFCKIPDILAQAKEREIAEELAVDPSNKHCAVNNIPVQKGFQLSEMEGLWYEIARTRFTFNKMESVISYHRYDPDDNLIKSFYTGTTDGNCSTPIQGTSRTKEGQKWLGNMEGKIDGDFFVWSPLKILYVDDNYLMFYACYSGDSDTPCIKDLMEVTLVGRSREIRDKKKKKIYKILPKICIDPSDMIDTIFSENCTEWVENVIREKDTDPSDCILDEVPAYHDFDDISMLGEWYLAAYTNYSTLSVLGNILNITRGPAESLVIEHADFDDEESCHSLNPVYARPNCIDTGDHVMTLPATKNKGLVFSKILYQDDNTFVNYICTQRNVDGRCDIDGVHAFVYTKNQSLTDMSADHANKALKTACISPDQMQYATDWCSLSILDAEEPYKQGNQKYDELEKFEEADPVAVKDGIQQGDNMCDIDIDDINIFNDIDDFNQTRIYGYWYEITHSSGIYNEDVESFTAYFTSDTNLTLQIYYTGLRKDGSVLPVERATAIPRCFTEVNGDYLTEVPRDKNVSGTVSFAPMKVLFTDYDVLLTYICQEMLPNGRCSMKGSHIRLWSRNKLMDNETRDYVLDFADWGCIDVSENTHMLVNTTHDASVFPVLEEFVLENIDIGYDELFEESFTHELDGQQADETEPEYDDFEESLQRYLDMTDEEFYYAQK